MKNRLTVLAMVPVMLALGVHAVSPAHAAGEPEHSHAYHNNWKPTPADTCSAELHNTYSVVASDGKLYPTWHPPKVTDPATGKECTFGHEHGDDPKTSDIYGWATDFLRNPDHPDRAGLAFGLAGEASMADPNAPQGHRHEDNTGTKVIVANNVNLVTASPRGLLRAQVDGRSQKVTCDFLVALHMGTHSADAFKNNAHELFYAVKCNEGTELITTTLTRLGNPNEFNRSCDPNTVVKTSGSTLPAGEGGRRLIPDRQCVDQHVIVPEGQRSDLWGLYEVWETSTDLRRPDGSSLAHFDPWLAVRNPSRFHDGDAASYTPTISTRWESAGTQAKPERAREWPWASIAEGDSREQGSLTSPFNGAERDYYLKESRVDNAGGPHVWYADAYGRNAQPEPGTGLVKQWLSSTSNASWPELERRNFDLDRDHGPAGSGVHAPN